MPLCSRSAALARVKGKETSFSVAGNPSDLVNAIFQVLIIDPRDEMHEELRLDRTDIKKLCAISTNVTDHISVRMDSLVNMMLCPIVIDKLGQLRSVVNVILEGHENLSDEMSFRLLESLSKLRH